MSPLLSEDTKVACVDCHHFERSLTLDTAVAELPVRPKTVTNSISLLNVRFNYRLGWSGKFEDLGEQNDAVIENPAMMGTTWPRIADRLKKVPIWVKRFSAAFPDGITAANVRRALIGYEASLTTPDAPFDRWLLGDSTAIPSEAIEGFKLFKVHGCVSCHQGIAVGGNMLQKFGVMREYPAARQRAPSRENSQASLDSYVPANDREDRPLFRVPSLRNVALTSPYFHDGSTRTLAEAVDIMGQYQLGKQLASEDIRLIVAFLETLSGQQREAPQ